MPKVGIVTDVSEIVFATRSADMTGFGCIIILIIISVKTLLTSVDH